MERVPDANELAIMVSSLDTRSISAAIIGLRPRIRDELLLSGRHGKKRFLDSPRTYRGKSLQVKEQDREGSPRRETKAASAKRGEGRPNDVWGDLA